MRDRFRGVLIGAAFLMATSAVGPGFLTQTAVFTERLGASFGFAILVSIVIDLVAQLNIWRVIAISGQRAPAVANAVISAAVAIGIFLVKEAGRAMDRFALMLGVVLVGLM